MAEIIQPSFVIELSLSTEYQAIAGLDEVGRGALAGPIVSAAVVFTDYKKIDVKLAEIADSKILTSRKRGELEKVIMSEALDYSIGEVSATEIDKIGIGAANILSFERAIIGLNKCDFALIDGRKFRGFNYPYRCLVKGESKSISIAAASILAKVYRDRLMVQLSGKFTKYDFENNVGYGSSKHHKAIKEFGPSPLHRNSFLRSFSTEQAELF